MLSFPRSIMEKQHNEMKGRTGLRRLRNAVIYSLDGYRAAWRDEEAFRQIVILLAAGILSAWQKLGGDCSSRSPAGSVRNCRTLQHGGGECSRPHFTGYASPVQEGQGHGECGTVYRPAFSRFRMGRVSARAFFQLARSGEAWCRLRPVLPADR